MGLLDGIRDCLMSWGVGMAAEWMSHVLAFAILIGIAFLADLICRHVLLGAVAKLVKRTKATWDDVVFDRKVMVHLSRLVVPVIVYTGIPLIFADAGTTTVDIIQRVCFVFIVVSLSTFAHSFLKAVYSVYSDKESYRNRPLKSILQTVQVLLWFVGGVVILSELVSKEPFSLLAGLGASAAVLMLVFKDTIMGFVSGVQLSANDMLKVGDWIKMPKYNADGIVIEMTLNTVKVKNWDNTVTTIPPYALVCDSFQNWNAMRESGGRRIKRSVNIDMNSVKFCTPEMWARFRKIALLKDYMEGHDRRLHEDHREPEKDETAEAGFCRPTNLKVFRAYLTAYLRSLPYYNPDLHGMVRYLQPTEKGLPVELYFFSTVKEWVRYEGIQADVLDHVLAVIPEFGLRVFQSPSGTDVQKAVL
ncbi:MAG: mechanosensitive ion channel family protein [Paraprevotella sp.]|nr:mechanosensitive ion channel family protein [Paraprevotella sp.]